MRIQTNILLWGFFAFLLPLTSVSLVATYYSQARHLQDIETNVNQNLLVLATEIERRLAADRALAMGLSHASAIQQFLPVLDSIDRQTIPDNFKQQIETINLFFEGFQTIIPSSFIIRIHDSQGNTLIKVNHNKRSKPVYESIQGFSYVEHEINNIEFVNTLRSLPQNDVTSLVLPHNKAQPNLLQYLSLLDNVVPLYYRNKWVGALSLTIIGDDIDKILSHVIRPAGSKIIIAETNPDIQERHGLILFDDNRKITFSHARAEPKYLYNSPYKNIIDNISDTGHNVYTTDEMDSSVHYIEMTPYPNQFINWIFAFDIPHTTINQPYEKIRLSIWLVAATTMLFGLVLTQIGAQRITRTLSALVSNFKNYAQGDHHQVASTDHCVDEIKDLGQAFNDMTNTLNTAHKDRDTAQRMMLQSSKLASIGQMAAGIGHEINNPLNNILSYAKLALRNIETNTACLDSKVKQSLLSDLNSLREESLRASEIVKGIMNFARQVPPHFTDFNIENWLNNSVDLVQQSANNHKVTFERHIDVANHPYIKGDRGQLQQVLVNLLLNAIQASDKNNKIIIVAKTTHQLEVSIIDQGSGIPEQSLEFIFDPFFSTKQKTQGTGLGLSISLGIIQDHHGNLEITNNDTHGVTAKVILPFKF